MAAIPNAATPGVELQLQPLSVDQSAVYGRLVSNMRNTAWNGITVVVDGCRLSAAAAVQNIWHRVTVDCPAMGRNCVNYAADKLQRFTGWAAQSVGAHKDRYLLVALGVSACYFNSKVLTGIFCAKLAAMYTEIGEKAWNGAFNAGSKLLTTASGAYQKGKTAYQQAYTEAAQQIENERLIAAKERFITAMQQLPSGAEVSAQAQTAFRAYIHQMPSLLADQDVLTAIGNHHLEDRHKHPLFGDRGFLLSLLAGAPAQHLDQILQFILGNQQYTNAPRPSVENRRTFFVSLLSCAPSVEHFRLICQHLSTDRPDREVLMNGEFVEGVQAALEPVYMAAGGDRAAVVDQVRNVYRQALTPFVDNRQMSAMDNSSQGLVPPPPRVEEQRGLHFVQ